MAGPFIEDAQSTVEAAMCVGCILMGLSHMLQPQMWRDYFDGLYKAGAAGVVKRTFALELWPALIIVILHPVWSWPGIVLTLYGWILLAKCTVSVLAPEIGLRSLEMAREGERGFVIGGAVLVGIGISAGLALVLRP
jgi:hypothetical protein